MTKKNKKKNSQLHVEYSFLLSFQPNASLATSDSPNAQQTPRMSGVDESPRPQSQSYASGAPTTPQMITSPRPQSQSYASGAPTTPQAIISPHIVASDTSDSEDQYEEHMLDSL